MTRTLLLVLLVACKSGDVGSATDRSTELSGHYRSGDGPTAGTKCETQFGTADHVDGDVTHVATYCHVDDKITPGPCS